MDNKKHSMAIAYALKRKAKMAKGGDVHKNEQDAKDKAMQAKVGLSRRDKMLMAMGNCPGPHCPGCSAPNCAVKGGGEAPAYAEGGMTETGYEKGINRGRKLEKGVSYAGAHQRGQVFADSSDKSENEGYAKEQHKKVLGEMKSMKKPNLYADGGQIKGNYQSQSAKEHQTMPMDADGMEKDSGYVGHEGDMKRPSMAAVKEDDRMLNEHGETEAGPMSGGKGFHGESYEGNPGNAHDEYQDADAMDDDDLVSRVMKQRMYSKGGQVANSRPPGGPIVDEQVPEGIDYLATNDDLEFSETGANEGDDLGSDQEDEDRDDIVSRVMRSWKKGDRMPRPA